MLAHIPSPRAEAELRTSLDVARKAYATKQLEYLACLGKQRRAEMREATRKLREDLKAAEKSIRIALVGNGEEDKVTISRIREKNPYFA